MTFKLEPVTSASDIPRIAEIHLYAFLTSSINSTIYYKGPSQAILDVSAARHLESLQNDPTVRFVKVIEDSTSPPKFIAFAKFNVFESAAAAEQRRDTGERTWPPGTNIKLVEEFWSMLVKHREEWGPRLGRHIGLDILATDPEYHRRGAGQMLMSHVIDLADEMGVPCYLEGSPEGVKLYRSCGFEVVARNWTDLWRFADGKDNGPGFRKSRGLEEREGVGEGWYQERVMVRPAKGERIENYTQSET